jgi:hypothetical protein
MTPSSRHLSALEIYMARNGVNLSRDVLPDCVHGRVSRDRITLRTGLSPEQEFIALVHELAHWLVHRDVSCRVDRTLFEYEAEAVESLVLARLGLTYSARGRTPFGRGSPTDNLLSASVLRVTSASDWICLAFSEPGQDESEPQASVYFQTAASEEIVFEDERYGMGDFLGLPEAL